MAKSKIARSDVDQVTREMGEIAPYCKEVPGVGVCQHDLHFAAGMIASGFGVTNPDGPVDIVQAAVNQASFELKILADRFLDEGSNEQYWLLGIIDRLEAAAESAEIMFKLTQLPHIGNSKGGGQS